MALEFTTLRNATAENLMNWFEQGWEVHLCYYESHIDHIVVQEEIPQYQYVTTNNSSGGYYHNHQQPTYMNKTIPVAKQEPVFILKRSAPAKVLYGQKDDNTTY